MKERVIVFGDEQNLVGIYSEPDDTNQLRDLPCVLMLNAGIIHRVGPFRLHVAAARHLADHGYRALRFDIAGIGDSLSDKSGGFDEERLINDVITAMNKLEQSKGIHEFVLMGLCTGAANAHKVAVVDKRVRGGIFLDGYAYPTWRFYIRRYLPGLINPARVINRLRRSTGRLSGSAMNTSDSPEKVEDFDWWKLPPKAELRKELTTLIDRGVNLFYVHSGSRREVYNYQHQFAEAFSSIDFNGKLQVIINAQADHTYTMTEDRIKLLDQISDWMNKVFKS